VKSPKDYCLRTGLKFTRAIVIRKVITSDKRCTKRYMAPSPTSAEPAPRQHGVKGAYVGGDWVDIGTSPRL